ncbi:MAG: glycerate kinase [Butyrivibrio sp.]|uniref:glycerate kinase n=1 Tax=Butyrivibrio sp. TaxID=28121 RepID=UPI0025D8D5D5|nr:glycerate kinase [Butyrivibrio sp.]MCR5772197.1 glycerate kinase [Butyrivibrio sp.]
MKIVVAIDSFKGSLTSMEAGEAAKAGILKAGNHKVTVMPLADGGEGTTQALISGLGGQFVDIEVTGPLGSKVTARYGILSDNKTAVIEMAEAAGITLVDRDKLDPWKATSYGLGEMIKDAMERGCREFIIGIGGSATTEVGFGMLQALGYKFYDSCGQLLSLEFENLDKVDKIDLSSVDERLELCHFNIACDVKNPLYGTNGALYVFGPQKGVKEEEKAVMDKIVRNFAMTVDEKFGVHNDDVPGTGAAGGLGFAFKTFFKNVSLKPGIEIVLDAISLEKLLVDADVVVTGEGRLDGQTAMGKVPVGVARLAKKHGCKVIAVAGSVTDDAVNCNDEGIDAFFSIIRSASSLEEAMDKTNAVKNMQATVEQIFRLLM